MTDISNHVCSLELARILKELGVKQESSFYWDSYKNINNEHELKYIIPKNHIAAGYQKYYMKDKHHYSAFLASELGMMLPDLKEPFRLNFGIENPVIRFEVPSVGRYYGVCDALDYPHEEDFSENNMANLFALMLIHLIENDLVSQEWRKEWME